MCIKRNDCLKYLFKITYFRVIHEIVAAMANDWRECIDVDNQLRVMTVKANMSHFFSNALISFFVFAGIFYLLGNYGVNYFVGIDNNTSRELPIKIQFPFEIDKTPIFELLAIILIMHLMLNGLIIAILNGFIFSLVKLNFYICSLFSLQIASQILCNIRVYYIILYIKCNNE